MENEKNTRTKGRIKSSSAKQKIIKTKPKYITPKQNKNCIYETRIDARYWNIMVSETTGEKIKFDEVAKRFVPYDPHASVKQLQESIFDTVSLLDSFFDSSSQITKRTLSILENYAELRYGMKSIDMAHELLDSAYDIDYSHGGINLRATNSEELIQEVLDIASSLQKANVIHLRKSSTLIKNASADEQYENLEQNSCNVKYFGLKNSRKDTYHDVSLFYARCLIIDAIDTLVAELEGCEDRDISSAIAIIKIQYLSRQIGDKKLNNKDVQDVMGMRTNPNTFTKLRYLGIRLVAIALNNVFSQLHDDELLSKIRITKNLSAPATSEASENEEEDTKSSSEPEIIFVDD